jgi:indole-3-glycerol phosphate synthase
MSFICEVKKASPSKGLIAPEFPYLEIARAYEEAGASAISCLTEPFYFQGQDAYLKEIAETVQIPVLRKDFTVDEYMIYQAKALGAGSVLLICAILDDAQLLAYGQLAQELGLSALVEAHSEEEVERALKSGAKIVGVNNRDLKTFQVDITTSARLRRMVPPEILFVSESGIRGTEDIRALRQNGTDAVLIGETLMRAVDKRALLNEWKQI